MYSFLNLLSMLLIAIVFVLIFKGIRKFFPKKYFELSRLVFGNGVTIRMRIIRSIVIFTYSYLVYLILDNKEATVFSIMLGSFLIVWPVLLNPDQFDLNETGWYKQPVRVKTKGKILLYLSYICFVLYAISLSLLAVQKGDLIFKYTKESFGSWADGLIMYVLLTLFFENGSKIFERLLSKSINKTQQKTKEYE